MKVTFTCEKCGWVSPSYIPHGDAIVPIPNCPNCAKLFYGPLTEAMLAEAIVAVADKWMGRCLADDTAAVQKKLAVDEARFVLRLLNEMVRARDHAGHPWQVDHERDWLLDLARQP